MAVARSAVGATATGTTSTVAVAYPASLAAGQVAVLFTESGNGADPAAPTGFTHAGSIGVGSTGTDVSATKLSVFYRVLDGSESGSVNANLIFGHLVGKMVTYTGADATTPVTLSTGKTQTPASTTQSTNTLASKAADGNDIFISVAGHDRDSATQSAYGSPVWNNIAGSDFSLIQTSYNGAGGGGIVAQELSPSGDSTGAVSGSGTITSSIWASFLIRINASGSMGGGSVSLTVPNFNTGSPDIGVPVANYIRNLAIANFNVGSPSYGPVTWTQRHALSAANFSASSPTFGPPTFGQRHALSIANFATASPSIGTPSLGVAGTAAFTINGLTTGSPTFGNVTLGQRHVFNVPSFSNGSPDVPTIYAAQRHSLSSGGLTVGSPDLGTPAFSVAGYELKSKNVLAADPEYRTLWVDEIRHLSAEVEMRVLSHEQSLSS